MSESILDFGQAAACQRFCVAGSDSVFKLNHYRVAALPCLKAFPGRKLKDRDFGLGRHIFAQRTPEEFCRRAPLGPGEIIDLVEHENKRPTAGRTRSR